MPDFFHIQRVNDDEEDVLLKIGFGQPAENDQIVVDAKQKIEALALRGGRRIRFDGPCSLPVAMVLAHAVAHLFATVAVLDPKINQFVVCISHDPEWKVGDTIAA